MQNLLRMVIVDDEKYMREALDKMIDWKQLGVEIIGYCKNGVEAYNYILDEYPDIVLTDIKMPGIDGIELIDQIKKTDKDIEFIILSGYGEFQFAQKAMTYGIRHYLLKPCDDDTIVGAVRNVRDSILERKKIVDNNDKNIVKAEESDAAGGKSYAVVKQMIQYIDEHMDSPELTLKWFAENYIYMNVDYISKIFYRETGQKFSDYVNQKRVDCAKKILDSNAEMTLNEIAEKVGFGNNPLYFSKVFKKYTAVTLTDYKKK